jgi:hypothetical protein
MVKFQLHGRLGSVASRRSWQQCGEPARLRTTPAITIGTTRIALPADKALANSLVSH